MACAPAAVRDALRRGHARAARCAQVRGVTKKGREFFRFASALTGTISHLDVAEAHIWAACAQVHNHFVDGADRGLVMAPDTITATEVCCE